MLGLAETKKSVSVVDDQRGSPTWTVDLARAIALLVEGGYRGIYHACNAGETTWYGFAQEIFRLAGKDVEVVADYDGAVQRPGRAAEELTL